MGSHDMWDSSEKEVSGSKVFGKKVNIEWVITFSKGRISWVPSKYISINGPFSYFYPQPMISLPNGSTQAAEGTMKSVISIVASLELNHWAIDTFLS